jgi:hypothetical protein
MTFLYYITTNATVIYFNTIYYNVVKSEKIGIQTNLAYIFYVDNI